MAEIDIFSRLFSEKTWQEYYTYKVSLNHLTRQEEAALRSFIEEKAYLPVLKNISDGEPFPVPEMRLIRKSGSTKKRTVYLFPEAENYVLKLMTFLVIRKYDSFFADDLYSFRVNYGVNKAIRRLLSQKDLSSMYSYKADISDYFNSLPVERILPMMEELLREEPACLKLLTDILTDPRVYDRGELICRQKGVMAGTPFSVFLANLYLTDLDRTMEAEGILYARYSDDIILFAGTEEDRDRGRQLVEEHLTQAGLFINEEKRVLTSPGEPWSFLGIKYDNGIVDISDVSLKKLKAKIRRRARALQRWQARKQATSEQAVKGFVRAMNKKFFDPDSSHELTWTRWYFPLITTDRSLKEIDLYMQYWIRALYAGRHREKNYDLLYRDMKALGYISLVHAYYEKREEIAEEKRQRKELMSIGEEKPLRRTLRCDKVIEEKSDKKR